MTSDSQIEVPQSFVELYTAMPSRRLTESRAHIGQRYEFCEDMANLLTEPSRDKSMGLGVDEQQVLQRTYQGLLLSEVLVQGEPLWVTRRLAELLGWPLPADLEWRAEEG